MKYPLGTYMKSFVAFVTTMAGTGIMTATTGLPPIAYVWALLISLGAAVGVFVSPNKLTEDQVLKGAAQHGIPLGVSDDGVLESAAKDIGAGVADAVTKTVIDNVGQAIRDQIGSVTKQLPQPVGVAVDSAVETGGDLIESILARK